MANARPPAVLSTCQESQWHCGGDGARCEEMEPGCADGEAPCRDGGHCVPLEWLCDNQDDCGDGSDEEGECFHSCGYDLGDGGGLRDREGVLVLLRPDLHQMTSLHPQPACFPHARLCHLKLWGGTDVLPVWPLPTPGSAL